MLDLDIALTGHQPPEGLVRQIHHYPASFTAWLESTSGGNPIWYLSDSGYSRVVWSLEDEHLFLTSNSRQQVKNRWEDALPQRQAVEEFLRTAQDDLQQESRVNLVVDKLLN